MHDAARESPAQPLPRALRLAISFGGGFQIMVLEICGFRVLQNNLGSSVVVTGTLLTSIMVVLSAGYYTGGRLSRRWQSASRRLLALLLGAALYSVLVHSLLLEPIAAVGTALRNQLGGRVYLQSLAPAALLSVVLYGPPVFVMSMISPYLIRLRTQACASDTGADAGVESGFFMSLSSIGSIVGTMLSSYLSVPFFGVNVTAVASSAAFFALVATAWLRSTPVLPRARWAQSAGGLGLAFVGLVLCGFRSPEWDPNLVYHAESHYGELEVYENQDAAGRTLLTYHPSRVYMHSMLFPAEPLRDMEGNIYFTPGLVRPPKSVLVLGSAAGGALRGLELAFPEAQLTGVDLDSKVHEVATDVFGVDPTRTALVTADARVFLSEAPGTYDLIIVDLFAGEFIPSHCVSVEFFDLLRQRLSPHGSVFINTNMNDIPFEVGADAGPFRAIRHLQSTLRAAGFHDLIENPFFNSIFAFPDEMSIDAFRGALAHEWQNAERPLPLRAAAGLTLYTSFAVPPDRDGYRAFTDRWTPAFLIELKTNPNAIYAELERLGTPRVLGQSVLGVAPAPVLERVLARHYAEWRDSNDKGLVQMGPLIALLNEVKAPLGATALDAGARYLQFADEPEEGSVVAESEWAELAELYGRMHTLGHANDYEGLLGVLDEARARLQTP
jgi:predicted membrane-bound spermidine synthase